MDKKSELIEELKKTKTGNEFLKCTECENYNHEKHYCPTFCEVIRNTCKENKEYYIELLQEM